MAAGILICGLNGAGKSTLGKALAEELGFRFIDSEDLYFPKTDPAHPYAVSRTRGEVESLLLHKIREHGSFVFTSVKGDYGAEAVSCFRCAVLMEVPREIRLQRVRDRSFRKFGERMLPGGDLYEQEERFFDFAASRAEDAAAEWAKTLRCPVIRVDGTRSVEKNIAYILTRIKM